MLSLDAEFDLPSFNLVVTDERVMMANSATQVDAPIQVLRLKTAYICIKKHYCEQ